MTHLLIVHHSPTDGTQRIASALIAGANDDVIEGVVVDPRPPNLVDAEAIIHADGILIFSPANFGYMAGLIKDMFDRTFLDVGGALSSDGSATSAPEGRKPFALCVHGRYETEGAVLSIERIVGALPWRRVAPPLSLVGEVDEAATSSAYELGASIAALLT